MKEEKEITIYDLAKALGLSPATVSRGLKEHPGINTGTRKKIREMADRMGYQHNHFARNLRARNTNTIGVIIPRLNSYFMSTVIAGIEKVAQECGYNLIISQSQESVQREIANVQTMFNSRVDGLLVSLSFDTDEFNHFDLIHRKEIPLIFFDRVVDSEHSISISIDNVRAGYDVTMHLLEQGCRRILHIGGTPKRNVYADRLQGYRNALSEKRIPIDPSLIIQCELREEDGFAAADQLLSTRPLPDGVFAANDTVAAACIKALKDAGLDIPRQIAVAGFNNDPISRVIEPDLTTIHYPGQEMGELAAATLINAIRGSHSANLNNLILRHQLIVRKSSHRMTLKPDQK